MTGAVPCSRLADVNVYGRPSLRISVPFCQHAPSHTRFLGYRPGNFPTEINSRSTKSSLKHLRFEFNACDLFAIVRPTLMIKHSGCTLLSYFARKPATPQSQTLPLPSYSELPDDLSSPTVSFTVPDDTKYAELVVDPPCQANRHKRRRLSSNTTSVHCEHVRAETSSQASSFSAVNAVDACCS